MASAAAKGIELPRKVILRPGALGDIAPLCRELGLTGPAAVLTGPRTGEAAGRRVADSLREGRFETALFEAPVGKGADELQADARKARFLVGVGGGRVIDLAKVLSTRLGVPFLSVPTAASHDGVASNRATVNHGARSLSVEARAPLAILADTAVIARAPPKLLRAGCGDIVSNLAAVLDYRLAHKVRGEPYSGYAAALSEMTARILLERAGEIKPGDERSAHIVMEALISSGVAMAIAGSSRPASGAEHMFSHALDRVARKPALHGLQTGAGTLPVVHLHGGDWRAVREGLKKLGVPTNAEELGIADAEAIEALVMAPKMRPDRWTILGEGLTKEQAAQTLVETEFIAA
ncbi:MAG: NAD(P)-dependent glycerol-1-phosphate dehydrogenase [Halobacteria archaeon]